jgi:NTE family protein
MNERPRIGLALAGGIGYCLAHIGVLKALEEENVTVDTLAGTSGGALIGALYASGIKAERIEEIAKDISWGQLMSPTMIFKNKGLLSSEPIEKLVEQLIGRDRRFSELKLPFSVATVDLISGDEIIFPTQHDELIAPVVRASCSVPVVYAPVKIGDWLLSDGGIKSPLPIAPLKKYNPKIMIGVVFDIGKYEPTNLFDIGIRSMMLANDKILEVYEREMDVLIRCDPGQIASWDIKTAIKLIDVGYAAAKNNISKLKTCCDNKKITIV